DLAVHIRDHITDLAAGLKLLTDNIQTMLGHQVTQRPHCTGQVAMHMKDTRSACWLLIRDFREVYRPFRRTRLDKSQKLLSDFAPDVFLGLLRTAANVRREDHIPHPDQGADKGFVYALGFDRKNVQRSAGQMTRFQGLVQVVDVYDGPA